jgi:ABC-type nitrate/sulfonate/bicarbonate transport system permease component
MSKRKTENFLEQQGRFSVLVVPAAILLLWEFFARFSDTCPSYFPAPSRILGRLIYLLLLDRRLIADVLYSLKRLMWGTVISVPVAIVLGMALALHKTFARFFLPLVSITYPIPKLSILPLLMIILGIGDFSKIALIAAGIFYFVLLSVIHAIQGMPEVYFEIMKVYKIPFGKRIFSVILKGILPDILHGSKMGIGYGIVMVVASEFIAAKNGIGFFMWNAWDQFRIIDVYVALTLFSFMGIGTFAFFDRLIAKLKWRKSSHQW